MDDIDIACTPSEAVSPDHTLRIPFELLTCVLDLCSRRTICRAARVSQHWRAITLMHDQFYRAVRLTCGSGLDLSDTFDYTAVQLTLSNFANIGTPLKLELRILSDDITHRANVQKVARELARTMRIIKFLSISTVSPAVFDVLLEAVRASEAPLLRDMTLSYTHVTFIGGPTMRLQWPADLFASHAPRLESLALKEGVQPPDAPVTALRAVLSLAILKGVAQDLPLQKIMPILRDLSLQLRRLSDEEVAGITSSDLVRNLSLPTTLKRMDVAMVLGDHLTSDTERAMNEVMKIIAAAIPNPTLGYIRLPVVVDRMSRSSSHPNVAFFDPLPVLVGLPNRIAFRPREERATGWSSGYQCSVSVTPADLDIQNPLPALVRQFQSEEARESEVSLFAPNLLRAVSKHHDLVVLDVARGLLPDLLCTSLVFPTLERLELRLSAPSYPDRTFWPLMRQGSRVVHRRCRPEETDDVITERLPRLKVMWLYHCSRSLQVTNSDTVWPEEDSDLQGTTPNTAQDGGSTTVTDSGLEALVRDLGLDLSSSDETKERPELWLTKVVVYEDSEDEEDGGGTTRFRAVVDM